MWLKDGCVPNISLLEMGAMSFLMLYKICLQIEFYGDFDGSFHKSLELVTDLSGALLGTRSERYVIYHPWTNTCTLEPVFDFDLERPCFLPIF